jgi:hypothetical protein
MTDPTPSCPTTRRTWLARSVGLLGLTGLVGRATAAGEPIVVHHIGPFTGVLAASNTEAIEGARLALEAFNKRGGLAGRPVQLKTLDDGQDAKRSAALLDELLAEGKLLALMMPRTTPSLEAMMPAITARGVPVVGPQTGASFVNQPPKRELFTLRASYQKEAERAIRLQHSVGVRKFGLLLADDAFGSRHAHRHRRRDEGSAGRARRRGATGQPQGRGGRTGQAAAGPATAGRAADLLGEGGCGVHQGLPCSRCQCHLHQPVQHQQQRLPAGPWGPTHAAPS